VHVVIDHAAIHHHETEELRSMSTTIQTADRFTALPDERTVAETVAALEERGFSVEVVNDYDSARQKILALDRATQLQEIRALAGQPDFTLGSVHAITRDGTLVIASALGSQLAAYAWGAANVVGF
jgi:hypothetical protein